MIIIGVLVSGCTQQKPTCNKPYILVDSECCLDENNDKICDQDKQIDPNSIAETTATLSLDAVYPQLAECSQINDDTLRDTCVMEVAVVTVNPRVCERIISEIKDKMACYHLLGTYLANETLCDMPLLIDTSEYISPTDPRSSYLYAKENCYVSVAVRKKDLSFCEEMIRENKKTSCRAIIYAKTGMDDACELEELTHNCWWTFAIIKKDEKFCNNMEPGDEQDQCYSNIAWEKNDNRICNKISRNNQKDACVFDISRKGGQ